MSHIDDHEIARIEKGLKHGGLYVDPSMTSKVTPAMQVRIKAAIAKQDVKVFVVAVPNTYDDPTYHGDGQQLAGTIHNDLGGSGAYFVLGNTDLPPIRVEGANYGDAPYAGTAAGLAGLKHPHDIGKQLLTAVQSYQAPGAEAAYDKLLDQRMKDHHEQRTGQHDGGHGSSGPSDGLYFGGALIAVLVVAAVIVRRRRRTAVPVGLARVTDRPFSLPASVLGTITATRDRQREQEANAEVLALGEAIDNTAMRPDAASTGAWQAALDQYDLARRITERDHSPADVVGALVLARRGREALRAAAAGTSWKPPRSCYFNPLHAHAHTEVTWKGASGSVKVPACRPCAKAISGDHEPDDVLDFADGNTRRHYFDLDLGVWSQTAYGALDPDLVTRLFSTG